MAKNTAHEEAVAVFEQKAGVSFKDHALLTTAFTHRSYLNESHPGIREHNERLEFLGDAVLELSVTDHLFRTYPGHAEGDLTSYRAALVNAVILGNIAEELGMNECMLLSRGEARDTGRARATILANAFEAVVGALYLDQGYDAANAFILKHVTPHMKEVLAKGAYRDAKSAFQELAQAKYGLTPRYETLRAEGPDHDKRFVVAVYVGDVEVAEGEGKSKQEAEQAAAEKALAQEKTDA
ncbi:MAG: ribonuclease III [Patescibacteria group bacterium]|nr:ribonuclease III [Patescibacteria group bacterium]